MSDMTCNSQTTLCLKMSDCIGLTPLVPEALGKRRRRPSQIFAVRTLATDGIEEHASQKPPSASIGTSAKSVVESTRHVNARMLRLGVFEPCARHSFYVQGPKQITASDALRMPP